MQRGPTARFNINGSSCNAVIDSGAARSLVSARFAAACGLVSQRASSVRLVSASEEVIPVKGELSTSLDAKGLDFTVDLIIVEDLVCDMLLGRDFMQLLEVENCKAYKHNSTNITLRFRLLF
jgi:hypothetical protein